MKKSGIKKAGAVYTVLIFIVLYLPILIMVLYSFTAGSSTATFSADYAGKNPFGYWYQEMFRNEKAMSALTHSLTLAVLSSLCATVIGTAAAIGLRRISRKWVRNTINTVTNIPMMNPDIVTGLSMMLLFAGVFAIIGARIQRLCHDLDRTHYLQPALRDSVCHAEVASNGQKSTRGGIGSGLYACPVLLQGGIALYFPCRALRRHYGIYPFAG